MKYFRTYLSSRMLHLMRTHRFESPLLDIWCGPGYYLRELSSQYEAIGIDLSPTAIDLCASQGMRCACRSFHDVVDTYRSLVCIDVLEHVPDDRSFLLKMFDVLSDGGKAFVLVPSGPLREDDRYFGHYRRYSRTDISEKILSCGFRVVHAETFGYPFLHYARLCMLTVRAGRAGAGASAGREERTGTSSYQHYADGSFPARLLSGLEKRPKLNAWVNLLLSTQQFFAYRENGFAQIVIAEKPAEGR